MNNTKDQVALVTGASSGIGRATALAFAAAGARVVVSDVQEEGGEDVAKTIRDGGGIATFFQTDVSVAQDVSALLQRVIEVYGRLDFAFNNAGIEGQPGDTLQCSEANFDRTIAVNLKGIWLCMKYELPHMVKQGSGAIVNCSSVAGLVGFPMLPAYVASKHGVVGLTRTAALEFAKAGVRVNAVCPGAIRTPMLERVLGSDPASEAQMLTHEPIGRIGKPEEIAAAVLFLCSDGASFLTGQALAVDGGWVAQ